MEGRRRYRARTLSGQMDVESAVDMLHRLYGIIWPASRHEAETGLYPGHAGKWIRLFDEEEDWTELSAHVRCMEKQLWKWKYHEVKALFDAYFSEDTRLDYEDEDTYDFPYTGERASTKMMSYFCLVQTIEYRRIEKRRWNISRMAHVRTRG